MILRTFVLVATALLWSLNPTSASTIANGNLNSSSGVFTQPSNSGQYGYSTYYSSGSNACDNDHTMIIQQFIKFAYAAYGLGNNFDDTPTMGCCDTSLKSDLTNGYTPTTSLTSTTSISCLHDVRHEPAKHLSKHSECSCDVSNNEISITLDSIITKHTDRLELTKVFNNKLSTTNEFIYLIAMFIAFIQTISQSNQSTIDRNTNKTKRSSINQIITGFQSIVILLFVLSTFVNSSNAVCGPNPDCSIFLQTCSANLCNCPITTWQDKTPMSAARENHATVADDQTNIYVFGGNTGISSNATLKYTSSSDSWSSLASMPNTLNEIDGVFIDGKIYIPGDVSNPKLYIYTISSDSWDTPLVNKQSDGTTNIPGRYGYQVQKIGNKIYMMGGLFLGGSPSNQVWVLDVTTGIDTINGIAKWTQLNSMSIARNYFASAVILDKIYVAGGGNTNTVEFFDPALNSWTNGESIPIIDSFGAWYLLASSAGSAPNGKPVMYLAGGYFCSFGCDTTGLVVYYDPSAASGQKWVTSGIPTITPRLRTSGALSSDGYFYVTGGIDESGNLIGNNQRLFVCLPPDNPCWNVVCQSNEICISGVCKAPQFTLLPVVQSPQSINSNLAINTFSIFDLVTINSASVQFGSSTASCTIQTSLTPNYYAISCPQTISYSTSGTKTIGFIVRDTLSASTSFNSQTLIVGPPQFTSLPLVQSPQSINNNLAISTFNIYDLVTINSASVLFETSTASCTIQTSLTHTKLLCN